MLKFQYTNSKCTVLKGLFLLAGLIAILNFNSSLSAQEQVEIRKITNVEFIYPFWSPDGQYIVYQSDVTGNDEIYVMNADGSDRRQLTHNSASDITPVFSPDGESIAFVSDRDGDQDIYIMNLEGEVTDKVTRNNHRDIHPYWSPDGEKIIFNSGKTEAQFEIVEIRLDGSGKIRKLTNNNRFDSYASYSPDGSLIAYVTWYQTDDGRSNGEIILATSEGKFLRRLTENEVFDGWPSWSSDGKFIIYASADMSRKTYDLNTVDIQTGEISNLTYDVGKDARANMSNDGSKIIFNREINGSIEIMVLEINQ